MKLRDETRLSVNFLYKSSLLRVVEINFFCRVSFFTLKFSPGINMKDYEIIRYDNT